MRLYFNLFLAFLATASGFYLTWRFTQPELNGHWHIIQDDSTINPGIATIDIDWHNHVRANSRYDVYNIGIGGPLDRFRRHVFLFPTCLSLELDLSWNGDTLVLTKTKPYPETRKGGVLKAIRFPKGKCTAETDYFLRSGLHISLPVADPSQMMLPYEHGSLSLFLTPSGDGESSIIDYDGELLTLDELVEEAEKVDIKNYHNDLSTISIFADEGTSDDRIDKVMKVFAKEGKGREVYLVKKVLDGNGLHLFWVKMD